MVVPDAGTGIVPDHAVGDVSAEDAMFRSVAVAPERLARSAAVLRVTRATLREE
jgi:hypothetical protein